MQFGMAEFRSMVHGLVAETRRMLMEDLLFGKRGEDVPAVPWHTLRDNPVDNRPGWSFLQDQRSQLPVNGQMWLFDRVGQDEATQARFIRPGTGMVPDRKGIEGYMSQIVEYREKLLVLMHITGGQPARSPEILSVRHSNTAKGEHRNTFIEDGMVVFATRYHKGYALSGDVKIIHRYLPREVGELVVWYLWLVLPFQQDIEALAWQKKAMSAHMWPADPSGKKWTSERMRRAMKRESVVGLGQELTIQAYREVAIGISRKYMRGSTTFRMDEEDEDGDWNEDEGAAIADEQAGHTSHIAGMIYARGVMEQSGVVASKRQRFRASSITWHRFLGFASSREQAVAGRGAKRTAAPFEVETEEARVDRWKKLRTTDVEEQLSRLYGEGAKLIQID
ncbi:hypothetical protein B0A49_14047 [Cryomyces minteri]|uniref:Uncharacterized protein n=1 Tax=Cryomyces minteri TaxID=331657 RepID=A0A4U0UUB1_9PEZI|nr:hypothetical protein B0A49_14047 [Cryomyces minteri]